MAEEEGMASPSQVIRRKLLAGELVSPTFGSELGRSSALVGVVKDQLIKQGAQFETTPDPDRPGRSLHRMTVPPPSLKTQFLDAKARPAKSDYSELPSVAARIRAALLAGEALTAGDVIERFGGNTGTSLHDTVRRMERAGYRFTRRDEPSPAGGRSFVRVSLRSAPDHRPPAPVPAPTDAAPAWVGHAIEHANGDGDGEPSAADLLMEVEFLRDRVAHLSPAPPVAPEFGAMLRVAGLYLEPSGQVRMVLRNGKQAYVVHLEGVSE